MTGVILRPTNPIAGAPKILEFPYTPQIDYSNDVKYDSFTLTHTNYQPYAYARTENPQISLQAKFSSHTLDHFKISERAIRFLRVYTKMNYGRDDKERGQTPRIIRFFAMGNPIFYNVPVVISKFSITFPEDVDYIQGKFDAEDTSQIVQTTPVSSTDARGRSSANTDTRSSTFSTDTQFPTVTVTATRDKTIYLPAFFQISISLLVQQNIARTVREFTLEKFGSGQMSRAGYI